MSLKPRLEFLVKTKRLPLELLCSQVLRVRSLLVVEDEKQSVRVELPEELSHHQAWTDALWEVGLRVVRIQRRKLPQTLDVMGMWQIIHAHLKHPEHLLPIV